VPPRAARRAAPWPVAPRPIAAATHIEFVFVQTAFQSQQQAIVTEARAIDGFQIDQDRIDHTTHLDEVLPLPTIPGESRHLTGGNTADVAQTDFGHDAFKAGARDRAGGGPTQVFIHHLDLTPAYVMQPVLHRILQPLAFEIVIDLVGGGLACVHTAAFRATCCDLILSLMARLPPRTGAAHLIGLQTEQACALAWMSDGRA
jgi:hypothetical protein